MDGQVGTITDTYATLGNVAVASIANIKSVLHVSPTFSISLDNSLRNSATLRGTKPASIFFS
ncbi:hypothetical protein C5468_22445 [Photorhabdus luminescens subsp. mexicana]|uniref:Uncharacterized protein n=1 Tax=Photorhabdus luminescens subsp. mexicana TaxID=2100167 RepID=A0A4R4IUK9_PHOLU|nr:hypothetical protein C5468_22445 [Photorhabdus luminescens subsp. mexicana]